MSTPKGKGPKTKKGGFGFFRRAKSDLQLEPTAIYDGPLSIRLGDNWIERTFFLVQHKLRYRDLSSNHGAETGCLLLCGTSVLMEDDTDPLVFTLSTVPGSFKCLLLAPDKESLDGWTTAIRDQIHQLKEAESAGGALGPLQRTGGARGITHLFKLLHDIAVLAPECLAAQLRDTLQRLLTSESPASALSIVLTALQHAISQSSCTCSGATGQQDCPFMLIKALRMCNGFEVLLRLWYFLLVSLSPRTQREQKHKRENNKLLSALIDGDKVKDDTESDVTEEKVQEETEAAMERRVLLQGQASLFRILWRLDNTPATRNCRGTLSFTAGVSIVASDTHTVEERAGKLRSIYSVRVSVGSRSWVVDKRFSEVLKLCTDIKNDKQVKPLLTDPPKLPGKVLGSNYTVEPAKNKQRMMMFNEFFTALKASEALWKTVLDLNVISEFVALDLLGRGHTADPEHLALQRAVLSCGNTGRDVGKNVLATCMQLLLGVNERLPKINSMCMAGLPVENIHVLPLICQLLGRLDAQDRIDGLQSLHFLLSKVPSNCDLTLQIRGWERKLLACLLPHEDQYLELPPPSSELLRVLGGLGLVKAQQGTKTDVDTQPGQSKFVTIELALRCRELIKMDLLSKSDPVVVAYITEPSGRFMLVDSNAGETEEITDEHNPNFVTRFHIPVDPMQLARQQLKLVVYDQDVAELRPQDRMGFVVLNLFDCLINRITTTPLKPLYSAQWEIYKDPGSDPRITVLATVVGLESPVSLCTPHPAEALDEVHMDMAFQMLATDYRMGPGERLLFVADNTKLTVGPMSPPDSPTGAQTGAQTDTGGKPRLQTQTSTDGVGKGEEGTHGRGSSSGTKSGKRKSQKGKGNKKDDKDELHKRRTPGNAHVPGAPPKPVLQTTQQKRFMMHFPTLANLQLDPDHRTAAKSLRNCIFLTDRRLVAIREGTVAGDIWLTDVKRVNRRTKLGKVLMEVTTWNDEAQFVKVYSEGCADWVLRQLRESTIHANLAATHASPTLEKGEGDTPQEEGGLSIELGDPTKRQQQLSTVMLVDIAYHAFMTSKLPRSHADSFPMILIGFVDKIFDGLGWDQAGALPVIRSLLVAFVTIVNSKHRTWRNDYDSPAWDNLFRLCGALEKLVLHRPNLSTVSNQADSLHRQYVRKTRGVQVVDSFVAAAIADLLRCYKFSELNTAAFDEEEREWVKRVKKRGEKTTKFWDQASTFLTKERNKEESIAQLVEERKQLEAGRRPTVETTEPKDIPPSEGREGLPVRDTGSDSEFDDDEFDGELAAFQLLVQE